MKPGTHPWHCIDIGTDAPSFVKSIIEIPKGSKGKYEMDKDSGMLRLDRVLFSSVHYPANYGFIPQTYCDDHDPLDILVICSNDLSELPPHTLVELKRFFEDYKMLEHKNVIVEQFMNREKAYEIILESKKLYQVKKDILMQSL